jgi:hypothetical protein
MKENPVERSQPVFVKLCEFQARPGLEREFERIYGPQGDWAQLFRRCASFLRTELHSDMENPGRYVTADYFLTPAAYQEFLREVTDEYQALDQRCEAVRASERTHGSFLCYGNVR